MSFQHVYSPCFFHFWQLVIHSLWEIGMFTQFTYLSLFIFFFAHTHDMTPFLLIFYSFDGSTGGAGGGSAVSGTGGGKSTKGKDG